MKILILDIETSPMLAFIWKMFRENVGVNQLIENSYILSFAAKWYDSDEMFYFDNRKAKSFKRLENDKSLVKKLWKMIDDADLVVGHNVRDFDIRVFNARCFAHEIDPPSPVNYIDTKLIALKHFRLPSYKLEYLTTYFNKTHKKLKHEKYGGFELWVETVLMHNEDAWIEMEKYNKVDVLAVEELYFNRMFKWDNNTNFFAYQSDQGICVCGSNHYKRKGFAYTNTGCYQRYKCCLCGRHWRSTKSINRARYTNIPR